MLKIRRSHDRLIFNMGIPIPEKDGLYIESGPRPSAPMVLAKSSRNNLGFTPEMLVYYLFSSLSSSDVIWWHKSGSTLAQVVACILMVTTRYLNQCWLVISMAPQHSSVGMIIKSEDTNRQVRLKIALLESHPCLTGIDESTYGAKYDTIPQLLGGEEMTSNRWFR